MTTTFVADLDFAPGSAWLRWLERILGVTSDRTRPSHLPVYRITRIAEERWVVERPGAAMEHAFFDLEQAVTFVRRESFYEPATVELRADDLLVIAQLDPSNPSSLFGEAPS
jgi:hypothetical protein